MILLYEIQFESSNHFPVIFTLKCPPVPVHIASPPPNVCRPQQVLILFEISWIPLSSQYNASLGSARPNIGLYYCGSGGRVVI